MLDEEEYAQVLEVLRQLKRRAARPRVVSWEPILDRYRQLTGHAEREPAAVLHHRVSLYGPPCCVCGRPLRTPRARRCVACGHRG